MSVKADSIDTKMLTFDRDEPIGSLATKFLYLTDTDQSIESIEFQGR